MKTKNAGDFYCRKCRTKVKGKLTSSGVKVRIKVTCECGEAADVTFDAPPENFSPEWVSFIDTVSKKFAPTAEFVSHEEMMADMMRDKAKYEAKEAQLAEMRKNAEAAGFSMIEVSPEAILKVLTAIVGAVDVNVKKGLCVCGLPLGHDDAHPEVDLSKDKKGEVWN